VKPDFKLNGRDILKLHELVLRSIEDDFAGKLRNSGVRIAGANFVPPNAQKVSGLFNELVSFVNENPSN
jgi:Fic family protein